MKDRNASHGERRPAAWSPHGRAVSLVRPFDGVGRALASAYPAADQSVLPQEMTNLLDKLDRMGR